MLVKSIQPRFELLLADFYDSDYIPVLLEVSYSQVKHLFI